VDAARAGARRAFAELGIEHAMPTAEQWMSLVGHPIAEGFARLFADLAPAERALVRRRCEEEEHSALKSGQAALLPGVADALTALKERGAKYTNAPLWQSHVAVSGRLVTGQNPASAKGVADAVISLLART